MLLNYDVYLRILDLIGLCGGYMVNFAFPTTYFVLVISLLCPGQARIDYNMLATRNCKINPDMCRI